jgi:hypothetical protein
VLSFLPSNNEVFAIEEVCSYQHSAAPWHRYLLYYQSISSALVEEVCSYQHSAAPWHRYLLYYQSISSALVEEVCSYQHPAAWQALNHGRKNGALLD